MRHPESGAIVIHALPIYVCPSHENRIIDDRYGPSHYAASSGTVPGADNGLLFPMSAIRFRDITDGTSNTLAAGEIAFEIGGWARGAINAGGGGGGGGRRVLML